MGECEAPHKRQDGCPVTIRDRSGGAREVGVSAQEVLADASHEFAAGGALEERGGERRSAGR